jgi:hypothetical protein
VLLASVMRRWFTIVLLPTRMIVVAQEKLVERGVFVDDVSDGDWPESKMKYQVMKKTTTFQYKT